MIALLAAVTALQQAPAAQYRPAPDTVFHHGLNVFTMYLVRGADTLGRPLHKVDVERTRWIGGRRAELWRLTLDTDRRLDVDTLDVAPNGRITAINGRPPEASPRGSYDAWPRLPEPVRALRVGTTWTDSIHIERDTTPGRIIYSATRRWRVTRLLDTLGVRAFEAVAEGTMRYRDAYWTDSAAGKSLWIDVSGPFSDRFWFDPRAGRLLGREWSMHLTGRGALPRDSLPGVDTVAAGLRSSNIERAATAPRAALMARDLPGTDTLLRVHNGAAILLHVSGRTGDTVSAAMARNDGMVGTARAVLDTAGRPQRYDATWTDSTAEVRHVVRVIGDSIVVDGRTERRAAPSGAWAVADYSMDELLMPALRGMARTNTPHQLAIYRPWAGTWQTATVRLRPVTGGAIAVMHLEGDTLPTVLLFADDGALLAVVRQSPDDVTEATPPAGSARGAQLERIIAELQRR